jgi:prolyl oligopeptidase
MYPITRKTDQVDDYHGTLVADPYRWLEDDRSDETARWVAAQNDVTFGYLDRIPWREALRQRLTALVDYPRTSAPEQRGPWLLFARNDGLQNQPVYYVQRGETGEAEVLLDPNALSPDGTTRVAGLTFDRHARYIAYMVSHAGSDWQQIRVIDVETRQVLPDTVDWVKVSAIAWHGDGFFYSRYPEPGADEGERPGQGKGRQRAAGEGSPRSARRVHAGVDGVR